MWDTDKYRTTPLTVPGAVWWISKILINLSVAKAKTHIDLCMITLAAMLWIWLLWPVGSMPASMPAQPAPKPIPYVLRTAIYGDELTDITFKRDTYATQDLCYAAAANAIANEQRTTWTDCAEGKQQ